jgi:Chaperone of endosialidase
VIFPRGGTTNALFNNTGSFNIAWALVQAITSPQAVTTSILATLVLLASRTQPASARPESRPPPISPASVGVATANANAVPVVIDSAGQLGTVSSSRRFKEEIKPMDNSSEAILGLKPVTFHYKSDKQNMPQFGLIAEEVAKVNPDLVVRDENGQIYTVRYDAVNAMLLNEFLKEHRNVAEQRTTTSQRKAVNPTIKPYTSLVCSSAIR